MARWAPARRDVIAATVDEILQNYRRGRITIGVDGRTASGKSTFADDLAREFERRGLATARASLDDFLAPAGQRYARGRFSPEGYYRDAYAYDVFRRVLIEPFRMGGSTAFVTAAYDRVREVQLEPKWRTGPEDVFLIVDGGFLDRPELAGVWNYTIWLDADDSVRAERLSARRDRAGIRPRRALRRRPPHLREGREAAAGGDRDHRQHRSGPSAPGVRGRVLTR